MPSATDVLKTPLCPELADDFLGIALILAPRPHRGDPLILHGSYRIPWALADAIEAPLQRALVLVVQNGDIHHVATPFRGRVLFSDDERETREGPLGHFTMDVFALQGGFAPGDYHLLVSLGEIVSAVVRAQVL